MTIDAARYLAQAGVDALEVVGVYKGHRDHATEGMKAVTVTILRDNDLSTLQVVAVDEDGRRMRGEFRDHIESAVLTAPWHDLDS